MGLIMLNLKMTLYKKLLFLASGLGALILLVALISIYTYKVQNNRDNFRKAHTLLLRSSQVRTDFSRKRDTLLSGVFTSLMNDFVKTIDDYKTEKDTRFLIEKQKQYRSLFDEYVKQYRVRGLDENHGVEGRFRESVHNIEDIIKSMNNYQLYVYMLQARRSEKDYIMRRKNKYIDKVKNVVEKLNSTASEVVGNPRTESEIHRLSNIYLDNFISLISTFRKIDSLETILINSEFELNQKIRQIAAQKEAKADTIRIIQIFVVVISIILAILISITLARSITKPVEKLRNAAIAIGRGDLDIRVNIKTGDEIQDLSESFNQMAGDISSSNKTILEQNKRLEDNNNELGRLTSDLQESLENLALLGSIGKSITSVLNFDDIITKLYMHLRGVIDSSTFAIGLVDDEKNAINYKLVIERSEKQREVITDLQKTSRIDNVCVLTGNEIVITDLGKDKAELIESYPEYFNDNVETITLNSMSAIYLPIIIEDQTIGVISIESQEENAYSSNITDWLRNIASYVAIAIINAQSYDEIIRSHEELKTTQNQLIQAEKMASLGQLTTGIAHEIKNPLNFITNYSDGTSELLEEIAEEFDELRDKIGEDDFNYYAGTFNEVRSHLDTIKRNGQRIDSIVRSMMEHARSGNGEKTTVNINSFIEEYTKLAYHGFRGEYKHFTAALNFELCDENPPLELNHQEISRVITNIVDNACYSTMKKNEEQKNGFMADLKVSTKLNNGYIEIGFRDNGNGIPKNIINKVMNPFFTTKPTGEGTGLGLSLSYDIIRNGHNGEMKFESEEGKYAKCIIKLPYNK